jgi:hypothetical protein
MTNNFGDQAEDFYIHMRSRITHKQVYVPIFQKN